MLGMPKDKYLKKQLMKCASVVAAVVLILAGIGYYSSSYMDDTIALENTKKSENSSVQNQYNQISSEISDSTTAEKYYSDYIKNHNPDFTIDRDALATLLAPLCKAHHIASNVELTVSTLSDFSENHIDMKSGKMVKSTVHIKFGALTDDSVYAFIDDLKHQLPGVVIISELKISRSGELSQSNLDSLRKHVIPSVVTGELSFIWAGINKSDATANGSSNGK